MRIPCDRDVVVIECRLSATSCMTNVSSHRLSRNCHCSCLGTAWNGWSRQWRSSPTTLPHGVTTLRIPKYTVPNKAIRNLLAFVQTNLIILNHPHGPSLASDVQKSGPKHSMKHVKYGGLIIFDKLSVPFDYLHYMFQHRRSLIEQ